MNAEPVLALVTRALARRRLLDVVLIGNTAAEFGGAELRVAPPQRRGSLAASGTTG